MPSTDDLSHQPALPRLTAPEPKYNPSSSPSAPIASARLSREQVAMRLLAARVGEGLFNGNRSWETAVRECFALAEVFCRVRDETPTRAVQQARLEFVP